MEDKELIEQVLKRDLQDIDFEPIPDENSSPLVEPVVQKQGNNMHANSPVEQPVIKSEPLPFIPAPPMNTPSSQFTAPVLNVPNQGTAISTEPIQEHLQQPGINPGQTNHAIEPGLTNGPGTTSSGHFKPPMDAPEQEIGGAGLQGGIPSVNPSDIIPNEQATMLANTLLGVANNVLEVGGGFFVKIGKPKDFYDFEEIIQVIDEQNVKNIKRLKLDEEDKALLRPLLVAIIRQKPKQMTPEQQLLTAILSIMMKKANVVLEIRRENEKLVDKIRELIRKETAPAADENLQTFGDSSTEQEESNFDQSIQNEIPMDEPLDEEMAFATNGIPPAVLEIVPDRL